MNTYPGGARDVALRRSSEVLGLVVQTFGDGSAEALEATEFLDEMLRQAKAEDAELFFVASGRLADLERRAYARRGNGQPEAQEDDAITDRAVLVKVSSVRAERVEWEWMHRIPRSKLTVLDGDPGLGKSTVALDLIARLTSGRTKPGDERELPTAGAVILSAEDGIADTIRPRLEAAGADLDRVAVLTAVRDEKGRPRLPVLPEDIESARAAVQTMGARLLVVDPLMAFLAGRVDSHRDQDVRGALALLSDLAEAEAVAILIIRHLNKTMGGHPIYRGGGSIGIIGAARAGLLVAPDPQDDTRRILAVSKSNLGPIPPSLAYRLVQAGDASRVEWAGIATCSAKDLLVIQAGDGDGDGARTEAEGFVRDLLADGPMAAKEALRQAKQAGIKATTLHRARARLGVTTTKSGGHFGGDPGWYWELPTTAEDSTEAEHSNPQETESSGFLESSGATEEVFPLEASHSPPDPTACPRCGRDSCDGGCP